MEDLKDRVVLVDEQDNVLGDMEKMEAHREGLLHRAISVLVFNSRGEWLLQRRNPQKYHSKGLWSNTCCTHPFPGETYDLAASRRLYEEMGMNTRLKDEFTFIYKAQLDSGLTEHELDHVFVGTDDSQPILNLEEVVDFKWISTQQLEKELNDFPAKYSAWFRIIFEKYKSYV